LQGIQLSDYDIGVDLNELDEDILLFLIVHFPIEEFVRWAQNLLFMAYIKEYDD